MDPFELTPGVAIADRFELLSLAGRGGAGVVFQALDRATGDLVALKILPPESTTEGMERMQREARALAGLRHPRVVGYIDHGCAQEQWIFLAMEWLEGEDLRRHIANRRLTIKECLVLVHAVAEGLAAVHRRGLVHRDIKPSNLFLRDGRIDRATLIDFGLARGQGFGWSLTRTGQLIGTLSYMAPEQALGERHLGPSADIFALGCVLYECLTGVPPFGVEHLAIIPAKATTEDPLLQLASWPGAPSGLVRLLRQMLAKDPAERLQDGSALVTALEAFLPGTAPEIAAPSLFVEADEQHLMTFALAVPRRLFEHPQTPVPADTEDPRWPEVEALVALSRARLTHLGNGVFLVNLLKTHLTAPDQAGYVARLMLVLKERLPEWALAGVTVRGAIAGMLPVEKALWIGAEVLRQGRLGEADEGDLSPMWLDELTARLLDARFQVRRVRGDAHVLEAERSDPDQQRLLLGRPTPCVGREQELFFLEALLTSMREDSAARAVLVLAPPGEGKSRLRHEFVRRIQAAGQGVEVLFGRADPVRTGVSHSLLTRALLGLCGLLGHAGPPDEREAQFKRRIGRHVPEEGRQRVLEFLGELCGLPFAGDRSPQLRAAQQEPRLMSEQLETAWVDFLRAECLAHPVLLVLEDLHWADATTVRLVDVALRELEDRPLMVLALARPDVKEVFPNLWEGRSLQELRLRALPRRACERLIEEALGARATPETVQRIVQQARGNALFLEELIRAVAEGAEEEPPETVLAMIGARFWRLDPGARRVLRAASLFGEAFWRGGLAELLGGEDRMGDGLDRWLQILVSEELIVPHGTSRFAGDPEFGFRHALLREAALGMLGEEDRRAGHRLAATYLERQGESDPLVLAEHYERGEMRERAAHLYAQAAAQALGRSDLDASLRCIERGVSCEAAGEVLGRLRCTEAWLRFWRIDMQGAYVAGCAALEVLPAGGVLHYVALGATVGAAWATGQVSMADEVLQPFIEVDPPLAARQAFLEAAWLVSSILAIEGRGQSLAALLERMERATAGLEDNEARNRGLVQLVRATGLLHLGGDLWELRSVAAAGAASFAAAGDRRMQGFIELSLGAAHWQLGDTDAARAVLDQAFDRLSQLREHLGVLLVRMHLALGLSEQGGVEHLAEARRHAEVILTETRGGYWDGIAHTVMARCLAHERAWVAAEGEVREAIVGTPALTLQPMMFAALTEILLGQGKIEEAVGAAQDGLGLLGQLGGSCWLDTRLYLAASEAYARAGQREEAQQALRAAGQRLEQRAEGIPDAAARARYLTKVPHHARVFELLRAAV